MRGGVWGVPLYGPAGLASLQNKPVIKYGTAVDPNAPLPVIDEEINRLAETSNNISATGQKNTKMASPNQILPANQGANGKQNSENNAGYVGLKSKFDSTAGIYLRPNYQKLRAGQLMREYEINTLLDNKRHYRLLFTVAAPPLSCIARGCLGSAQQPFVYTASNIQLAGVSAKPSLIIEKDCSCLSCSSCFGQEGIRVTVASGEDGAGPLGRVRQLRTCIGQKVGNK